MGSDDVRRDPLILGRVDRLVGFDVIVALAIAVRVQDERRPALRLGGVAGLVKRPGVHPPDDWTAATDPQRVVIVITELEMMSPEAGVDESIFHGLGVK